MPEPIGADLEARSDREARVTERQKLSEVGQVYITLTAARQYLEASRRTHEAPLEGEEAARRELAELLLDAVRIEGDLEDPERWRFRRKSERIDISARVVREGRFMTVLSVTARRYP
ncbi:MAG: hypothetical protein HYV07_21530 [Deltaproteobacteria bacterium]|nr:hypothetical protein [Deltaproteobacteria bacterium]